MGGLVDGAVLAFIGIPARYSRVRVRMMNFFMGFFLLI
jgi:hypothetical protein